MLFLFKLRVPFVIIIIDNKFLNKGIFFMTMKITMFEINNPQFASAFDKVVAGDVGVNNVIIV